MAKGTKTGGREKGTQNKKTKELIESIEKSGETPLQFLLNVMRSPLPPEIVGLIEKAKQELKPDALIQVFAALLPWFDRRIDCAAKAAPYVHPRLQTMMITGDLNVKHTPRNLDDSELLRIVAANGRRGAAGKKTRKSESPLVH